MKFLKTHYVSIILWAIGPPTFPLWATEMKEFLISQNTYFISVAVWSILFISFLWVKDRWRKNEGVYRITRKPSITSKPDQLPRKITFEYTLDKEDCCLYPRRSCDKDFSYAIGWEHDDVDDDGNLMVVSHSVALMFTHPREVDKVELTSLNNNDTLEVVSVEAESCAEKGKVSGVNMLCNENVGSERLRLTVYFND